MRMGAPDASSADEARHNRRHAATNRNPPQIATHRAKTLAPLTRATPRADECFRPSTNPWKRGPHRRAALVQERALTEERPSWKSGPLGPRQGPKKGLQP